MKVRMMRSGIAPLKVKRPPLLATQANANRRLSRSVANRQKQRVWLKQNGRCNVCGFVIPLTDCELDHVTPLSVGGSLKDWNTQCLCAECHQAKTSREQGERANWSRNNE